MDQGGSERRETTGRAVRRGLVDALPIMVAVTPFGLVVGAVAAQRGFTVAEAVLLSGTVFAGASQLVAVDLFGQSVPLWSILLAVLAVNFRHVLYSAAMVPVVQGLPPTGKALVFFFLVDPQFALAQRRFEEGRFGLAWYLSLALSLYVLWLGATAIGATFGALLEDPEAFGIDMLLPIYFLALVLGFRDRPRWGPTVMAAAAVSSVVYHAPALGIGWLGPPWHVTLGGLAGLSVAAAWPARPRQAGPRETRA